MTDREALIGLLWEWQLTYTCLDFKHADQRPTQASFVDLRQRTHRALLATQPQAAQPEGDYKDAEATATLTAECWVWNGKKWVLRDLTESAQPRAPLTEADLPQHPYGGPSPGLVWTISERRAILAWGNALLGIKPAGDAP